MDAEELNGATGEAVEERQGHGPAAWPSASSLVKPDVEFLDPTGLRPSLAYSTDGTHRIEFSAPTGQRGRTRQGWSPLPGACPGPGAAPELGPGHCRILANNAGWHHELGCPVLPTGSGMGPGVRCPGAKKNEGTRHG